MEKVFWVGGRKGGVGKSMVALACLDYLIAMGEAPLLIESDTANGDVLRCYESTIKTETADLSDANGWVDLLNVIAGFSGPVVINSKGSQEVSGAGEGLQYLPEAGKEIVALWVINAEPDSIKALKDFMEAVPTAKIAVVRNLFFGKPHAFGLFDHSKTREAVLNAGGTVMDFPAVADRVARDLKTECLSIEKAAKELSFGSRIELQRWRKAVHQAFNALNLCEKGDAKWASKRSIRK